MNLCMLSGRLTKDPELIWIKTSELYVCKFVIAIESYYTDDNGKKRNSTDFAHCQAWGKRGEWLHASAVKGDEVMIESRFKINKYKKGGVDKYFPLFNVSKIKILGLKPADLNMPQDIIDDFEDLRTEKTPGD
jgi:single stranded DNA-binding protein